MILAIRSTSLFPWVITQLRARESSEGLELMLYMPEIPGLDPWHYVVTKQHPELLLKTARRNT